MNRLAEESLVRSSIIFSNKLKTLINGAVCCSCDRHCSSNDVNLKVDLSETKQNKQKIIIIIKNRNVFKVHGSPAVGYLTIKLQNSTWYKCLNLSQTGSRTYVSTYAHTYVNIFVQTNGHSYARTHVRKTEKLYALSDAGAKNTAFEHSMSCPEIVIDTAYALLLLFIYLFIYFFFSKYMLLHSVKLYAAILTA